MHRTQKCLSSSSGWNIVWCGDTVPASVPISPVRTLGSKCAWNSEPVCVSVTLSGSSHERWRWCKLVSIDYNSNGARSRCSTHVLACCAWSWPPSLLPFFANDRCRLRTIWTKQSLWFTITNKLSTKSCSICSATFNLSPIDRRLTRPTEQLAWLLFSVPSIRTCNRAISNGFFRVSFERPNFVVSIQCARLTNSLRREWIVVALGVDEWDIHFTGRLRSMRANTQTFSRRGVRDQILLAHVARQKERVILEVWLGQHWQCIRCFAGRTNCHQQLAHQRQSNPDDSERVHAQLVWPRWNHTNCIEMWVLSLLQILLWTPIGSLAVPMLNHFKVDVQYCQNRAQVTEQRKSGSLV